LKKRAVLWIGVCAYCVLIFIGSSIPGKGVDTGPPGVDKLLHLIEYLILSFLLFAAMREEFPHAPAGRIFIFSIVLSSLYGLTDEIHQLFVTLRDCDVFDMIMDGIGSILGAFWAMRKYATQASIVNK